MRRSLSRKLIQNFKYPGPCSVKELDSITLLGSVVHPKATHYTVDNQ